MQITRFSAAETFGIYVEDPEEVSDTRDLIALMREHRVPEQDVTSDLIDITPVYLPGLPTRYFLSRRSPQGPAVVELMPQASDPDTTTLMTANFKGGRQYTQSIRDTSATIVIPEHTPSFSLWAYTPQYAGQLCVHELIVDSSLIEQ